MFVALNSNFRIVINLAILIQNKFNGVVKVRLCNTWLMLDNDDDD